MAPSINISYAVIALGDRETVRHFDLTERAAKQGATVTETYGFEPGEASSHDDLAAVPAVLTALSRAIATHVDIWMPFPMEDLGREQHVRRLSLILQRHGLNLLMGHELEPCTTDGGFSAIDYALRMEVRAVDELGFAALAQAAARTLGMEIEVALMQAAEHPAEPEPPVPAAIGEKVYSTAEVAELFGRSAAWVYRAMRTGVFTRPDGTPIEPQRIGKSGRRRFTLPVLHDMAKACYRRGIFSEDELLVLLSVLECAEKE